MQAPSYDPSQDATLQHWQALTAERRAAQLYRQSRSPAPHARIFCSNDYLGLMQHPELIAALQDGAARWGTGSGGSHLVSGHSPAHQALEAALSAWFSPYLPQPQALTFSTGYMANLALLTGLAQADTTLFCDKLNHASLIDAALLARAQHQCQVRRYPHADLAALERQLASSNSPHKLIVTDGVFSMDGDVADVPALQALAERYQAWLLVDDAHGIGTLGTAGQGSLAHFGREHSSRTVVVATFGKAAGVAGAAILAPAPVIEWLTQSARPYIYTTAMPPALAHTLTASVQLMQGPVGAQRREQLQLLRQVFQRGMAELLPLAPPHWQLLPSISPIQPLVVGDNASALTLSAQLQTRGFLVSAIRPPTVPAGTARLRFTLSAEHRIEDIEALLAALRLALTSLPRPA